MWYHTEYQVAIRGHELDVHIATWTKGKEPNRIYSTILGIHGDTANHN